MSETLVIALVTAGASILTSVVTGLFLVKSKSIKKNEKTKSSNWVSAVLRWSLLLGFFGGIISWSFAFVGNTLQVGSSELSVSEVYGFDPFYQDLDSLEHTIDSLGEQIIVINDTSTKMHEIEQYQTLKQQYSYINSSVRKLGDYPAYVASADALDAGITGGIMVALSFALGLIIGSRNQRHFSGPENTSDDAP